MVGPFPSSVRWLHETRWVRLLAFASGSAVLAFGAAGLVLGDAGVYSAPLAFVFGLSAWAVLLLLARPVLTDPGTDDPAARNSAIGAVALAVGTGIWNALNAGQHFLMDRDPAIYNNAGRWLAGHGTLIVDRDVGPLAREPFFIGAPGLHEFPLGPLQFQGAHFLPSLLAEARAIGGDALMFRTPALIGSVALLAFFVLASRVLRHPYAALGATTALAFAMPQVFFARDAYSELPTQVLLFTGIWMLCDRTVLTRAGALVVAGLSIGFIQATRIDALAIVAGLPPVFAVAWYCTARPERKRLALHAAACAIAVAVGVAVGYYDLRYRSTQYYSDLHTEYRQLVAVAAASAFLSVLVILLERPLRALAARPWVPRAQRTAAIAGAGLVVTAGLFFWLVWPRLHALGAKPDNATLHTRSVAWIGWYLGPVALALAIAGAALLVWALVTRLRWATVVATALLAPQAVLYLWRPSATADQVWVTRRLLVAAFPAAVLLSFAALLAAAHWIVARPAGGWRTAGRIATVFAAIALVGYPVWTVAGVARMSDVHGYLTALDDVCDRIGPDGALVVVQETFNQLEVTVPQPTRAWCGVPAAFLLGAPRPELLTQAAAEFKKDGRTLWIAAGERDTIERWFPAAPVQEAKIAVNRRNLAAPFTHRPRSLTTDELSLVLAPVPQP
jgi:hypothetical protein